MSRRNVHLNEVHPKELGVQKSKAKDTLDLDYIINEDSEVYL